MSDLTRESPRREPLDRKTAAQWRTLSIRTALANAGRSPGEINSDLEVATRSEPQSPVAPAYRLWQGDNLAREARYPEAIRAYDAAVACASSAHRFLADLDPCVCALMHKAGAAAAAGDPATAIASYLDLATLSPDDPEPLFHAGLVAEGTGDDERAGELYRLVASGRPSRRTDDPAQLARRALRRLESSGVAYLPDVRILADRLTTAIERRDTAALDRLLDRTHFAVGPVAGHFAFEELTMVDGLYRDLLEGGVTVRRTLAGSGGKRYLATTGWKGDWFRGDVLFLLMRSPKGWRWTGVGITAAHDGWVERWRPATRQTNQPIPITLRAPWPAGQSFKAGGLSEFVIQQAAVVAAGPFFGAILAEGFSRNPCGFGPRGFYYNQGSTHDEEDAFAIDFSRYERNVPYDSEAGGTPVLAVRDGVVARIRADVPTGDSSAANRVEIIHEDPADPAASDRFRSRYLHLQGPFRIPVSEMMFVILGQRLGRMDDTGNSLIDHLHFSIHDRTQPHPNATYGRSVRPNPLDGARLGDGDSGACVESSNVERVPGLNFTPSPVSFGSVVVGSVATRTVRVQNSAGRTVDLSFPASPSGSVFAWSAFSATLDNREETSFELRFRPASNAIARGTLTVTSDAPGSPHRIALIGKGPGGFPEEEPDPVGILDFRPDTITFGSVPLNTTASRTLVIENQTGASVNVSFPASPPGFFQWSAFSGSIAHGTERSFQLRFSPTTNGVFSATLVVTHTAAGSPRSIGIVGKGPGGF
jgi:hypothetical protein